MADSLPLVLVPGLLESSRVFGEQIPWLWRNAPVTIANHTMDDSMAAIAKRILATAPARFMLAGHSMGGYVAFEIMRQAPERVARLALLDTSARPDAPEQTERRRMGIGMAREGRFRAVTDTLFPLLVHPSHRMNGALLGVCHTMAEHVGVEGFVRQQTAIIGRVDSRPTLASIRCPTLVLVGDQDQLTPPHLAQEIAAGISGAKLVTIPEAGHLPMIEQGQAVTRALLDWQAG